MVASAFRQKSATCEAEWTSSSSGAAADKRGNYRTRATNLSGDRAASTVAQLLWYGNIIILIGRLQPLPLLHFSGVVSDSLFARRRLIPET